MEIEIRAKIKNKDQISGKLIELGFEDKGSKQIDDYYFGDITLYEKLNHSFWIRVRKKGEKITLAYKGPTETDGIYEEHESNLDNLEEALTIFKKMGLDNPINIIKQRHTFKKNNIEALIDDIENYGLFLEAEIISENEDKSSLKNLFKELNIPDEDIFEKGFITIFLQQQNSPFCKWIKN